MFLVDNIARLDVGALPKAQGAIVRSAQFLVGLWDQFNRDKLIIRASGLAFSSLLATVPLIAVIYAVLSAFGALDELKQKVQSFLFQNFLPAQHDELTQLLDQFTQNTGKLGFFGFAFLALAAVLLLDSVESNFNDIYHVTSRRRLISKITAYTSVLVFGTLFVGASLSISARLQAMWTRGTVVDLGWMTRQLSWSFPLVLVFFAFLLAYTVVPYTRVRLKSAVVGAAVAAVLFELAKHAFAYWAGQTVRYSAVYGSLAVVPIFLIWLYITWIVVLLGLEVAFTHQHFLMLLRSRAVGGPAECDRVGLGLRVAALTAERFSSGADPPTADQLSRRLLAPTGAVEAAIERLVGHGLLRWVALGQDTEGLVPARPPDRLQVSEVIALFQPESIGYGADRPVEQEIDEVITRFLGAGHREVADLSVEELLAGAHRSGQS
jgi:membrane protein